MRASLRLAAACVAFCLAAGPAHATLHHVTVTTFQYIPHDLTVASGDSVQWDWDMGTHTITQGTNCTVPPTPLFRSFSDPTHPVFIYRFTTPGTVQYFCEPHCLFQDMKGTVTVQSQSDVPGLDGREGFALAAPTPNPSRAGTMVRYELPRDSRVRLDVLDASGRLVRTLADESIGAGIHWAEWNGRDAAGAQVASGVYWMRIQASGFEASRSIVCLR